MILVVGGFRSGKREYVKTALGYGGDDFSTDINGDKRVLYDLQESFIEINDENIFKLMKKEVIISNEVGSGIVPVDPDERSMRENTGRLCIELAKRADMVIRVVCGIGSRIK